MDSTYTLNSLDDHRRDAIVEGRCQRVLIVKRNEFNFMARVEGRNDLRVIGGSNGAGGTTVEGFFESDDLPSAGDKRSNFKRVFIGFSS